MRKIFWLFVLIGGYFWIVSSGREELLLEGGKRVLLLVQDWLKDAELDFHIPKKDSKKSNRRQW